MEMLHGSSDTIQLFSCFQKQDEDHLIVSGPSGEYPSSHMILLMTYLSDDDVQERYPFGMLQAVNALRRMKVFTKKWLPIQKMVPIPIAV